jgi:hypothetical protein
VGGCYLLKVAGVFFFSFQFSHFATSKNGDHPQEDLVKSDYKKKKRSGNSRMLIIFWPMSH